MRDALFLDKSGPGASSGIWTCTLAPSSKGERVLMSLEMQLEVRPVRGLPDMLPVAHEDPDAAEWQFLMPCAAWPPQGFGKVVFPIMCKVYKPSASGAFHGECRDSESTR